MLRSTVAQESSPVYCAAWSSNGDQILYTNNKMLVIKSLTAGIRSNRWKAHDGLILKVDWNSVNNLIISGSEDCRYKVWDIYGRQLYVSVIHNHPVTSIAWSPNGDHFAVGSYNTIRLCDKCGWSYSLEKVESGSIYDLAWSSDNTQIAGACANGNLLLASIIERRYDWLNYELLLISRKSMQVGDIVNDTIEMLDFAEGIIQVAIGYKHIIVTTTAQCYLYNINNLNTPHIIELKDGSVSLILLAERHFLLVEKTCVGLYNYEGRPISFPKWPKMQCELINKNSISISNDTIAVKDQTDEKVIHILEIGSSSTSGPSYLHKIGISELSLNQSGSSIDRYLAIIDKNRDMYLIASTMRSGVNISRKIEKLGVMIESIAWNSDYNVLAAIQESTLNVWMYPSVVFVDRRLSRRCIMTEDSSELGRQPQLISFMKNDITVRRSDGAIIHNHVSPFVSILHEYANTNNWLECLKLCRSVKDDALWACLAGLAVYARELDAAEEAYAAIDLFDKVTFIQHIKKIKNKPMRISEMALLGGNTADAETVLIQNGLFFQAINMNMTTHRWNRALDLAIKHKTHVDTVLYYRGKYLETLEEKETNRLYLQFDNMELDPMIIKEKVKKEMERYA